MIKFVAGSLAAVFIFSTSVSGQIKSVSALPHIIVYKTRRDYRNLVPVELSADKTKIADYPGPQDIKTGGAYALPVLLHKGFLLDCRGVGIHSAFTKYTYEEYSNLADFPSISELMNTLVDKDPMVVVYDCGRRNTFKNPVEQINEWIDQRALNKNCKKIKRSRN